MSRLLFASLCLHGALALTLPSLMSKPAALPVGQLSSAPSFAEPVPACARAMNARVAAVRMQDTSFFDGYMTSDPATGEKTALEISAKEKLYLECLDAYYNEGGKQLLSDEDYEKLKLDLDFEGSVVSTYTADEIKFILANKRFSMGKPIMADSEYDSLRSRLKAAGSIVILHDAPSCDPDTGVCKNDLRIDTGKQRLLYVPGIVGGMVVFCELSYWFLHLDPLLSIVLGAIPVYFGGKYFTEKVFCQDPLVTTTSCPNCGTLLNFYFGDLLAVQTDQVVPGSGMTEVECKCPNCKTELVANRESMVVTGTLK